MRLKVLITMLFALITTANAQENNAPFEGEILFETYENYSDYIKRMANSIYFDGVHKIRLIMKGPKMHLIDDYWTGDASGSDWNSIDHNNTSAFCYRDATGGGNLSKHALGLAIDINPQQNPYVTFRSDGTPKYSHENAADYVTGRSSDMPHVITKSDEAYKLFVS